MLAIHVGKGQCEVDGAASSDDVAREDRQILRRVAGDDLWGRGIDEERRNAVARECVRIAEFLAAVSATARRPDHERPWRAGQRMDEIGCDPRPLRCAEPQVLMRGVVRNGGFAPRDLEGCRAVVVEKRRRATRAGGACRRRRRKGNRRDGGDSTRGREQTLAGHGAARQLG